MDSSRKQHIPFRLNVDGDFYVEDGCCITCGVMHDVAPELFSWSDDSHCFVSKQPDGPEELEKMIEATDVTEIDCVRYRGADPDLMRRFVERGQADLLDGEPPPDAVAYSRRYSLFSYAGDPPNVSHQALALRDYARIKRPLGLFEIVAGESGVVEAIWRDTSVARIEIQRYGSENLSLVSIQPVKGNWIVGLSYIVSQWQSLDPNIRDVRWLTRQELSEDLPGRSRPS